MWCKRCFHGIDAIVSSVASYDETSWKSFSDSEVVDFSEKNAIISATIVHQFPTKKVEARLVNSYD